MVAPEEVDELIRGSVKLKSITMCYGSYVEVNKMNPNESRLPRDAPAP